MWITEFLAERVDGAYAYQREIRDDVFTGTCRWMRIETPMNNRTDSRRPAPEQTLSPDYARMFASIARDLDETDRYVQDRRFVRAHLVGLLRSLDVEFDHFVTLRGLADVLDELADRQTVKAARRE